MARRIGLVLAFAAVTCFACVSAHADSVIIDMGTGTAQAGGVTTFLSGGNLLQIGSTGTYTAIGTDFENGASLPTPEPSSGFLLLIGGSFLALATIGRKIWKHSSSEEASSPELHTDLISERSSNPFPS
jgi:hypothetical protein